MIYDDTLRYLVIDLETGEKVPERWIIYSDDQEGLYRYYVPDAEGFPHVGADDKYVIGESRARIKLVVVKSWLESNFLLTKVAP